MKKKLIQFSSIFVIAVIVITFSAEKILRSFPWLIPYPYITLKDGDDHYHEMVKALKDPDYLEQIRPKIIVLGDSLTRSVAMPVANDWPGVLRKEQDIALFNLGVGGTSTFEQKLLLETIEFPKSVKIVLLNIYHNDILQNEIDFQNFKRNGIYLFAHRHINQTQKREHECIYSGPFKNSLGLYGKYCLLETLRNVRLRILTTASKASIRSKEVFDKISQTNVYKYRDFRNYPHLAKFKKLNEVALTRTLKIVTSIKKFLKKKNISLLVTYTPSKDEIYIEDWKKLYNKPKLPIASYGAQLLPHMKKSNIFFYDLTDLYRRNRSFMAPIFFDRDDHMNSSGHRLAAKLIAPILLKNF